MELDAFVEKIRDVSLDRSRSCLARLPEDVFQDSDMLNVLINEITLSILDGFRLAITHDIDFNKNEIILHLDEI